MNLGVNFRRRSPNLWGQYSTPKHIAEALIKTESQTQPYFDYSARELVAMLIMYVVVECDLKKTLPTLARVREILSRDSEIQRVTRFMNDLRERAPASMRGMINKAAQFEELNDSIRSVIATARQQLGFLDDMEIAEDLAGDRVDFREAKKRPVTVYLILPSHELGRHARWLRLVVTAALNAMMRPRRKGEPSVLFMMDEFPALGHMEIIETTWALVRGYGIQMMPVFQDLSQLRSIYKERADSFIGMAGAILHLPPNDATTAQWIMDRAGQKKEISYGGSSGQSTGRDTSHSSGRNWHKERIPRWTPQDLYGMEKYYMLVALAGERDIWQVVAPHYYKVEAYDKVARKNPYVLKD